ncbi:MAG TPA: AEC family transporter [Hyphomicrobiaceae bacterium]|nr:AEC family transporter [Hyphomicrobiaceae bacterium]
MLSILNLALPFFGLIFIGFACGKLKKLPDDGLAWMNFFIFYVALPALFFRILSQTPLERLARLDFVAATTLATACAFTLSYAIGLIAGRGELGGATVSAVAGGFGNVGYMGPGLALAAIGPEAAVPVALIFSFDALLIFSLVPLLMAFSGSGGASFGRALLDVAKGIFLNPLLISAGAGVLAAAYQFELPTAVARLLEFLYTSAAPCALFALGVTVALRPLQRVSWELWVLSAVKLLLAPILVVILLNWLGPFNKTWVATAVLMAALPPALTAYVFARQYNTWIEQASGVVLIGTLASVVTLTGVMWLVETGSLWRLLVLAGICPQCG